MKLAKKLSAIVLALCLTLCLGVTAFAVEEAAPTDQETVTIKKVYTLVGKGASPAETFKLEQVGAKVTDGDATSAPALGTITGAAFAEGAATAKGTTGDITIALPSYDKVGVYEYELKEVAGTTAGVTYYGNTIKLVVTVINGENGKLRIAAVHTELEDNADKSDSFTNTYSAGTLNVTKTVTGNLGDKSKYFEFKVTLTGEEGKTYGDSYAVTGGTYDSNPTSIKVGEETTFYLKDGETISIANLPYRVTYTVVETAADGYTTTKTGDTGTISAETQTAAFTNNKGRVVDTGVLLDNLPYALVLVAVLGGAAVLFAHKRRVED